MSRKVFLVAFGLAVGYLTTTFYGQQQAPVADQQQQVLSAPSGSSPAITDRDLKSDPLLSEMTELFLKDGDTNRKLEFPKDSQTKPASRSPSVYHAAELLLKAARILEADSAKATGENFHVNERVAQLRAIAAEMLNP